MFTFVLPTKEAALPHIREALAFVYSGNVFLESECLTGLICGCRARMVQNLAKINEVGLRGCTL